MRINYESEVNTMAMFKKGFGAAKEEKERQEKAREASQNKLWQFFLKDDGDEATVRFLTEEPINFDAHQIKNGKMWETYICPGDGCSLCEDGEKTSFKGAFLVVDKREVTITDKKTKKKKKVRAQLRIYMQGARVVSQLDRYSTKYGLTNRDYTVARSGSGTDTAYSFDPEDKSRISKEEIKNLLPEKIRDDYDGTTESLYRILEDQLAMMVWDAEPDEDDEDEDYEDVKEEKGRRSRFVDLEDDEDDDEYEEVEDLGEDEEDEPPRKRPSLPTRKSKPGLKGSFKSRK